ncbi:helix-turn-helix domain-containing protein [Aquimarina aggregata]|uniref:helix-turn-helix domain-containing protein n=1 Tax=Aquimarina aggregata TaxID=1642818 RepID=UPI00249062F0|nr:helix-turn-helix domain-containing protein [Aquimarina aggregata]
MNKEELFFNLNPVNFFIISGLIQNFILAGILFFKKGSRPLANRILSITIIAVTLHLTYLMILDTNLDNLYPFLLFIPFSYLTVLGPLVYCYTQTLTNINFNIFRLNYWHFVPIIIEVILQGLNIIYGIRNDQLFYNTPFYFYGTPIIYIWTAGSILYYLRLSLDIIKSHQTWAHQNFSNLKEITLSWLQKLIVYYRFLWVIWVPFVIVFLLFFKFQLQYIVVIITLYVLLIIMTYLTFWIGIEGLGHINIMPFKKKLGLRENKNFGNLPQSRIQVHINEIENLMKINKIYLDENLNLKEFATLLKLDPNLISYILNTYLKSNFHDFINQYRVEEVKSRLVNPAYNHITLLGIALDSGFNSKTTFNRVFKKITGITPSEFQRKKKNNSIK